MQRVNPFVQLNLLFRFSLIACFNSFLNTFLSAEIHSDSIILRDDFDSYHQLELNPNIW